MDELQQLLHAANQAIAAGVDPAAVDAAISDRTGGQFTSRADLVAAARQSLRTPQSETPQEAAQRRLAAGGGSALTDFLTAALQGATFNFGDELAGLVAGDEAKRKIRQRMADLRTLAPGAVLASEFAGGLLPSIVVPGMGAGNTISNAVERSLGSRFLAGTAGGIAGGAAGGALYGLGEGEGMDRLANAGVGALGGAVLGGLFGGVGSAVAKRTPSGRRAVHAARARKQMHGFLNEADLTPDQVAARVSELGPKAVVADASPTLARYARAQRNVAPALDATGGPVDLLKRRTAERGARTARAIRAASGIREDFDLSKQAAKEAVEKVRAEHYHPIEELPFEEGAFPAVEEALKNPDVSAAVRFNAPGKSLPGDSDEAQEAAVKALVEMGFPEDQSRAAVMEQIPPGEAKPPATVMDLQDALVWLRKIEKSATTGQFIRPGVARRAREAYAALDEAMKESVPGFREAQAAFRNAEQTFLAHDAGYKALKKSPRFLRAELRKLPNNEARRAYRLGLLTRLEEELQQKLGTGGAEGQRAVFYAETSLNKLKQIVGSDKGMKALLRDLARERTFATTSDVVSGNSTTAQQAIDMGVDLGKLPVYRRMFYRLALRWLDGNAADRRRIAKLLGEALLTQGPAGVQKMNDILRPPLAPAAASFGGAFASLGGGLLTQPSQAEGGLLQ